VTFPSPNEWPVAYRTITGITNSPNPIITAPDHGFTTSDINIVQVDFSQVKGMQDINGRFGFITSIIDTDNFTIALDTSGFHSYTSGGFCNINAGNSPDDPFTNIA
jgi:hypothetical protein